MAFDESRPYRFRPFAVNARVSFSNAGDATGQCDRCCWCLQKAGLINYNRGHVSILNREGLENASCECYKIIQQQLSRWEQESE